MQQSETNITLVVYSLTNSQTTICCFSVCYNQQPCATLPHLSPDRVNSHLLSGATLPHLPPDLVNSEFLVATCRTT
jgi:hypothetical protein